MVLQGWPDEQLLLSRLSSDGPWSRVIDWILKGSADLDIVLNAQRVAGLVFLSAILVD